MGGTWYRFRAEIRHGGWRFVLVTALLLGIGGGAALAAIAGARRTATAFDRLDAATIASDVLINPDDGSVLDSLPADLFTPASGVEQYARVAGIGILGADGTFIEPAFLAAVDDRFGLLLERPVVRDGRLPDPTRPEELFADPTAAAQLGLEVGDHLELVILTHADLEIPGALEMTEDDLRERVLAGMIGTRYDFTLVGTGVRTSDVVPGAVLPSLVATPAFLETSDAFAFFGGIAVRLTDRAAGVDAFVNRVRVILPGVGIDFQTTEGDRATIERAVRPQSVALLAFGLVTAVGVVAAVAQAFSRLAKVSRARDPALAGLGMSEPARRRLHLLRIAFVSAIAPLVMLAVAYGLSGIFPVGLARPIEPHRGLRFDVAILLLGGLALLAAAIVASYVAVRAARRDSGRRFAGSQRAVRALTAALPPTMSTGMRLAVGSGEHGRTVPAKSTIASAAVGVTVIIGALTFASSLDEFVTSPPSYGWDFDGLVATGDIGENQEQFAYERFKEVAATLPDLRGWAPAFLQQAPVGGTTVPAMGLGLGAGEQPHPTLVRGRLPADLDEVGLGAVTMRRAGLDLGDSISVGADGTPFEIVGTVVLPGLRDYEGSDQAALGVGALFDERGFQVATSLGFTDELGPNVILVDLADDGPSGLAQFQAALDSEVGPDYFIVEGATRPADVEGYARIRSTPLVLAGILGLLAAMTVGHGLIVSVRQRRRDFAVFRSLGFTRPQVMATVGWQATTVAALAAIIGVPLGIVLGRFAWGAVARHLGIVNIPETPAIAIALALPAALVLANVAAAIPARVGVRLRPGQELRAE